MYLASASHLASLPLHPPRSEPGSPSGTLTGDDSQGPALQPIGVVRTDPDADVVIQARYAPVTRGVVEFDPSLSPALDGLDRFDWAWLVTLLDRTTDPRDSIDAGADPDDALRPVPFLLAERGERVGIFASRYPARPEPSA